MKQLLRSTSLGLLLCVAGCSTTQIQQADPPKLRALLAPESVESQYASRDALMADPTSTPIDTDIQLIQTEAALRRANRDQIDVQALLEKEASPPCGGFKKFLRRCP